MEYLLLRLFYFAFLWKTDGHVIVHGGDEESQGLWLFDVESRGAGKHLSNASFISSVTFSPNGDIAVYGTMGADLFVIDVNNGKQKICLTNNRLTQRLQVNPMENLNKQRGGILDIAFHPQGGLVASAAEDGTIHLWQVNTGRLIQQIEGDHGPISSLSFDPDGTHLSALGLGTRDELRSTENPGALTVYRLVDHGATGHGTECRATLQRIWNWGQMQ